MAATVIAESLHFFSEKVMISTINVLNALGVNKD